ncbi:MAG TPA: hypothetical protein VKU85_16310, partial [bacterium]|nr:hypothetical protein [bacterium]
AWAAVWAEGGREAVGARFQPSEGSAWTPFRVASDWRSGVVPDDRLEAAAVGQGVIPAAALAGGHVLWASAVGDRVWYATPHEAGLRVACRDVSVFDIALETGDREGVRARPTGMTGTGLPDGELFLAWVRETDSGPRLESVILPGEAR